MDTQKAQGVVTFSMFLTFAIGTLNSVSKGKGLPSWRFVIGNGVVWVVLSALADAEPEVAGPLGIAVVTSAIFGEGGGVLTYVESKGEFQTQKPPPKTATPSDSTKQRQHTAPAKTTKRIPPQPLHNFQIPGL